MAGRSGERLGRLRARALACGLVAAAPALPPAPACAQSRFDAASPVLGQPDNPGVGQDAGSDGLPALRRDRLPDGPTRGSAGGAPWGEASGGEASGGRTSGGLSAGLGLDARGRTSVARTGGSGLATPPVTGPAALARQRAAPPRRIGTATRRITQEVVQVPGSALRLSPVVRNPVVGVPLPTIAGAGGPLGGAVLGIVTPGLLLANALRRPPVADDAYAPLGIKLGALTVLPAFTQSLGYDTNPDQITARLVKGSVALRSEAEVNFRTDSSLVDLSGELRGAYLEFPQNDGASRPSAAGLVRARVDVTRDLRLDWDGRFLVDTQRAGNVDLQAVGAGVAAATSRPLFATYGTTLGATQTFNRLSVSLRGSIDRSEFDDARLDNGTVIRQSDRNLNQFGLRLRTAYEVSSAVSPFVDVLADTRVYDLARDLNGIARDSDGIGFTAGAAFALGPRLTGEIAAGLQHRTYADRRLLDINAPLVNAALVWSLSPLTTVRFGSITGVTETTLPNSSGVFTTAATLEVQHDLLRNLSVVLGAAFLKNDYQSSTIRENGFSATARLDYRFTRWLTLRGTYVYQRIDSTLANASFQDNTFLLGLRVSP